MKKQGVMVYVQKDDRLLFLVRNKENDTVHKQGMLLSIGGKVEEGESLKDAAIREAQEEAGITLGSLELRGVLYFRKFGTEVHDWVDFLYVCKEFSGTPRTGNEGSFVWKEIAEIDTLNIYEQDKVFLDLMLKHSFFVAEFLCDGQEMVEYTVLKAL